jgi:hypothetical protein
LDVGDRVDRDLSCDAGTNAVGTTRSRVRIPPAPSRRGRSSVGRACVSANFVVAAREAGEASSDNRDRLGAECMSGLLSYKETKPRREGCRPRATYKRIEAWVNAGGITWLGGLNAFEGSNPSLRKQSISRQTCHPVGTWDRHECSRDYMGSEVAGSNPAGRIERCGRSSTWLER